MNNWKPNWDETRQHFTGWWNREDMVLGMWGHGYGSDDMPHANVPPPAPVSDLEKWHTDSTLVAARWHHDLSRRIFPADTLPIVRPSAGTVDLAAYLGAEMSFQKQTVWYDAVISDPDGCPPLTFDPTNHWYVLMEETLQRLATLADGNYMVGLPGISPNLDVLAELRGTSEIMMDFFDRPDWIKQKLEEIDAVYFEVYDRMYDMVKQPDGSSVFYPFMLWGPGKVTQLQGDAAAMISEDMFREFMMPGLQRVAEWTDQSLFHVDGPGMIKHVDALLEIEALDAIQFTPGPGVPRGGDPHWFEMYHKILAAGKCLQAVWMSPEDVLPLIEALGTKGLYLMVECGSAEEMDDLEKKVRNLRVTHH